MTERTDDTGFHEGELPAGQDAAAAGVRGGDAYERMDGDNSGGADGDTQAREELRVKLGERAADTDRETGDPGLGS
jgi:hypothetical protein